MPFPRWVLAPLLGIVVIILSGGQDEAEPVLAALAAPSRILMPAGPGCPLTFGEEVAAVAAFKQMMPVIRHPRCSNCHGGVNPFAEYAVGKHFGGKMDKAEGIKVCQECHAELEGWDIPGTPLMWTKKSEKEICMQFKDFFDKNPDEFVGHMYNDNGGIQFIETAFKGERALNDMGKDIPPDEFKVPFVVTKPPGTREELRDHAKDWVDAIRKGWNASPECGCEVNRNGWIGRSTAAFSVEADGVRIEEHATASVLYELDEDMSTPGQDMYWQSMAGKIDWVVKWSGKCDGSFSGTMPVDFGGDENRLSTLQITPVGKQQRVMVSIGPWQNKYIQIVKIKCDGPVPLNAGVPQYVSYFWGQDPLNTFTSDSGRAIKGSYTKQLGPGTMLWTWDFTRIKKASKP